MDDERLSRGLDRRAHRAAVPDMWPAVSRRLDDRAAPARVARWAPLAGLAGAAVILIALFYVVPRPPIGSDHESGLHVLSTGDFAVAHARGDLANQTVLVDGRIDPYARSVGGAACKRAEPCLRLIGQLAGIGPDVPITAQDVAVVPPNSSSITRTDGWPAWTQFTVPITGTLVLSVDGAGSVEYLGRIVAGGARSSAQVKDGIQLAARDLDEIVLVNAWLTGVDFPAPCASPTPSFPGLPSTHECGLASWLVDQPSLVEPIAQAPSYAVEVQPDAYGRFAPQTTTRADGSLEPQRAVYAIAKRLYGQFCVLSTAPCWSWSVVGRLSQAPPDTRPPSIPVVSTPGMAEPTSVAGDYRLTLSSSKSLYFAAEPIDIQASLEYTGSQESTVLSGSGSGLVAFGVKEVGGSRAIDGLWTADCKMGGYTITRGQPLTEPFRKSGGVSGSDPNADFWRSYMQDPVLHLPEGRWEIGAVANFTEGAECSGSPAWLRASIEIEVTDAAIPSVAGSPSLPPKARTIGCGTFPVPPGQTPVPITQYVIDTTGLLVGCAETDYLIDLEGEITVANPFTPETLDVRWVDHCGAPYTFTFSAARDGFDLVGEPSGPCGWNGGTLQLTFSQPMPSDLVRATLSGDPSPPTALPSTQPNSTPGPTYDPTGRIINCGSWPESFGSVTVADHSGYVKDCVSKSSPGAPDEFVAVHPGADVNWITIAWQVDACKHGPTVVELSGPHAPSLDRTASRFDARIALARGTDDEPANPSCPDPATQSVDVNLVSPIAAADVAPWMVDGSDTSIDRQATADGEFSLTMATSKFAYATDEAIDVTTMLLYEGDQPDLDVSFDASFGLVGPLFVQELNGDLAMGGGSSVLMCGSSTLTSGERYEAPFRKAGAPPDAQPDPRISGYYDDPLLHLPPGIWRIWSTARFAVGPCSQRPVDYEFDPVELTTSVVVAVY